MIFDSLTNADRYSTLHPLFPRAFEFLRQPDLALLARGRYPIEGESLRAIVEQVAGRSREAAKLECHRQFIDIQYVLAGTDKMGWRALHECRAPLADYQADKDIRFFQDAPASWIATPPGVFCIFFPEDAHAPLVSAGEIHKVIIKVAV